MKTRKRNPAGIIIGIILLLVVFAASFTVIKTRIDEHRAAAEAAEQAALEEQRRAEEEAAAAAAAKAAEQAALEEAARKEAEIKWMTGYLAGTEQSVSLSNEAGDTVCSLPRGTCVEYAETDTGMLRVRTEEQDGLFCLPESIVEDPADAVSEQTLYVRTRMNLQDPDNRLLAYLPEKGEALTVTGYDYLNEDGSVHMYRVTGDTGAPENEASEPDEGETADTPETSPEDLSAFEGYIRPHYLTDSYEEAISQYDEEGSYQVHAARGNPYGGGSGDNLDYFPREKGSFEDNVMPEEVRALYLTSGDVDMIEDYIAIADSCGINAFVFDITDGCSISYSTDVMLEYSPTNYSHGYNTKEEYAAAVQKLKDAGYYVIGRITTFTDSYFVADHPECAILDETGSAKYLNGSYWPTGCSRLCWEYKVALAVDAVESFGLNEIQFDYVRFPDLTMGYERAGTIDYQNTYGETKAQAIQCFLMYACDVLHEHGVYVSADVFGESAYTYVTAYGQYWPAISNVVDAISGMPYPDHFGSSGDWKPWEHPYDTVYEWALCAAERQKETASPAIVRTWIQCYNAIRAPYNHYGETEVGAEIRALRDGGLTGGYMTWNGASSRDKYREVSSAFNL